MTILTWHGKDDAVKKARKTPYRLLREAAEFSHNLASSAQLSSAQLSSAQ